MCRRPRTPETTLDYIQRDDREGEEDRFYIHRDFYRTLAIIASEFPKRGHVAAHPHLTARELITDAVEDGVATEIDGHAVERITDQSERGGDKLNAFVISEFLRAIRIDRTAYDWAIENRAEARLANSSIVRLIEMSPLLAARVRQARDTRIDTLGDKQSALEKSFEDLRDQHPMITDVRREIEELLPLMLLAPGGAYREILTELIEEMRAGHDSGPLPETQQRDLDRLIEHRGELESGNARRIIQAMASLMSEEGSETNVNATPTPQRSWRSLSPPTRGRRLDCSDRTRQTLALALRFLESRPGLNLRDVHRRWRTLGLLQPSAWSCCPAAPRHAHSLALAAY